MTSNHSSSSKAFVIETTGTDLISEAQRWATPRAIGSLWAGSSLNVEYFVYGALLMGFGFNFATTISLILIGNLSFFLVGIASLQGPEAGTTGFTINRAPFGVQGSKLFAFFNWITLLGFETEGLILIVGAALVLLQMASIHVSSGSEVLLIIFAAGIQAVVPYFGHATMVKVIRVMIIPFAAIFVLLAYFDMKHALPSYTGVGGGWELYSAALAFVFALSGLGWTNCANDYTRYVPRTAKKSAIVGWVFLGTAVPETLLMLLGATTFTFLSNPSQVVQWNGANPFQVLYAQNLLPRWFVVLFLLFAILQLFAVNSLDLYSSGVSLQAMGVRIKRYQAVLLDSLLSCVLTIWAMFQSTFSLYMKEFVGVIIVWIGPWLGIFLMDWLLRRMKYSPEELQRTDKDGMYYGGRSGVRWNAVVAFAVGVLSATVCFSKAPPPVTFPFHWMTPISNHFAASCAGQPVNGVCTSGWYGGADFSVFAGVLLSALVYFVLEKRSGQITRQVQKQEGHESAS